MSSGVGIAVSTVLGRRSAWGVSDRVQGVADSAGARRRGVARIATSIAGGVAASLLAALGAVAPAAAITLQVDYAYGGALFDGSTAVGLQRQAVVDSAAAYVSSLFTDTLAAITPGGGNTWTAAVTRPDTHTPVFLPQLAVPADTVIVYAGAQNLAAGVLAQTSGAIAFGAPSGSPDFLAAVANRGQPLGDFGPFAGTITFGSAYASQWYLNPAPLAPGEVVTGFDLWTIAVHEMAHLLGFGRVPEWNYWVSGSTFQGPQAMAEYGGPVPVTDGALHWGAGVVSTVAGEPGVSQVALMNPTIHANERRFLTALDVAGLQDTGWEVATVPLPASWVLIASAGALGAALRRRGVRPAPRA